MTDIKFETTLKNAIKQNKNSAYMYHENAWKKDILGQLIK